MKRIILAIDSFKGCLSSVEAEEAAEHGLNERWQGIEVVKVPVTDGGDGMLEVFLQLSDCERVFVECHDALMRPIRASYAVRSDDTIIIETALFGPQKGATTEMIGYLDRRAHTFSRMASVKLGVEHAFDKGAGAAGGLGYAFLQFMNAKIQSGVDILFETINFDAIIDKADLIITGEGSADAQTLMGKLPVKDLEYGRHKNIHVVLIAGRVADVSSLLSAGFSQVECVTPSDIPFSEAIKPVIAKENIRKKMFKL